MYCAEEIKCQMIALVNVSSVLDEGEVEDVVAVYWVSCRNS